MDINELKRVLEAFLFVSSSPVMAEQVKEVLGADEPLVEKAMDELKCKYDSEDSGLKLIEIAGGYRISTSPDLANHLKKWFKGQKSRLSKASIETLSIIAYKQPVTRGEIEAIRGVNVEGPIDTLLERGLIRITGRRETVGRPILYGTTRLFLEHFGLNTLKDLPILSEFSEFDLTEEDKVRIQERVIRQDKGDPNGDSKTS